MIFGSEAHHLFLIFRFSMLYALRLMEVEVWKYLVLRSVVVNQVILDFCLHKDSSLLSCSMRFSFISSSMRVKFCKAWFVWMSLRMLLRFFMLVCIWPKLVIFQCFKACFVTFNFLVRMYAGVPENWVFQASLVTSKLEWSRVQNSSNLKFFFSFVTVCCVQ